MTDMLTPPGEWTPGSLHHHFSILLTEIEKTVSTRFVDLQAQMDRRIETQMRERADLEQRLQQAIASSRHEADIRFQAQKEADARAERERAAAADVLRKTLSERITSGDAQLREHVAQQVEQLKAMVSAASRETQIRAEAAQEAIAKADAATEKRFEAVNEFRAQLGDQVASFVPRDTAKAEFDKRDQRIEALKERLDNLGGREEGVDRVRGRQQFATGTIIAAVAAAAGVIVAVIVAANALTG